MAGEAVAARIGPALLAVAPTLRDLRVTAAATSSPGGWETDWFKVTQTLMLERGGTGEGGGLPIARWVGGRAGRGEGGFAFSRGGCWSSRDWHSFGMQDQVLGGILSSC
jgi:hypothetical protein